MTNQGQTSDKNVAIDPRTIKCASNQWGIHRWSQAFKDKISPSRYFQILRCRYCAKYLIAQFERLLLPSGRVTVVDRYSGMESMDDSTLMLRWTGEDSTPLKRTHIPAHSDNPFESLTHPEGATAGKQHDGQDKTVATL